MPEQTPDERSVLPRVLFVDDEPGIRVTLPAILESHGFQVTTTSNVAEALDQISKASFDILISDLHIGQPGDGFTVVSAMRRTQPAAITIILTGYPAFETALEAIRAQVDDYVVKPAHVERLIGSIQRCLEDRGQRPHFLPRQRVSQILRDNQQEVMEHWLALVHGDAELNAIVMTEIERADFLPGLLQEIVCSLEGNSCGGVEDLKAGTEHGRLRKKKGYSIPLLLKEGRFLRQTLCAIIEQNLLAVDVSYLIGDLFAICDCVDAQFSAAIESYLERRRIA